MQKLVVLFSVVLGLIALLPAQVTESIRLDGITYEITLSQYDAAKENVREEAFTEWLDMESSQQEVNVLYPKGKTAIITELRPQHFKRRIYIDRKSYTTFRSGRTFEQFADYHKKNFSKGYELLTLTKFVDQFDQSWYSATWVSHKHAAKYDRELEKYGISKAIVHMYRD